MPGSCSSIDALIAGDPDALDNTELKATLVSVARARAQLDAFEARVIAAFEGRGGFVDDGMVSVKAWLAHHTLVPRAAAGGRVLLAKRLRRMPLMADALAAGVVTDTHARALGRCLTPRTLEAFARDEAMLVETATTLEADDYEIVIAEWLRLNDLNGPEPGAGKPSELRASPMLDGRTRIDGELDCEDSAEFLAELDECYQEQWSAEQAADLADPIRLRSHAERNAAALVEMARRSSAAGDRDADPDPDTVRARPRRPQLIAVVDIATLTGDQAGRRELEDGRLLPLSVVERWACDCSIGRVVMAGRSIPIDLGTITYTPSAGQRRALIT